jgi:hypothetical protein
MMYEGGGTKLGSFRKLWRTRATGGPGGIDTDAFRGTAQYSHGQQFSNPMMMMMVVEIRGGPTDEG